MWAEVIYQRMLDVMRLFSGHLCVSPVEPNHRFRFDHEISLRNAKNDDSNSAEEIYKWQLEEVSWKIFRLKTRGPVLTECDDGGLNHRSSL